MPVPVPLLLLQGRHPTCQCRLCGRRLVLQCGQLNARSGERRVQAPLPGALLHCELAVYRIERIGVFRLQLRQRLLQAGNIKSGQG